MVNRTTILSKDRKYRYTLWRDWFEDLFDHGAYAAPKPNFVMFIGLNPSIADETKDDATIRICRNFSKRWGYSAMCMTNLFAYRATDPKVMQSVEEPIGPFNDDWLVKIANEASLIVAVWGVGGSYMNRAFDVVRMLGKHKVTLHHIGLSKEGFPRHPLRLKTDTQPKFWR